MGKLAVHSVMLVNRQGAHISHVLHTGTNTHTYTQDIVCWAFSGAPKRAFPLIVIVVITVFPLFIDADILSHPFLLLNVCGVWLLVECVAVSEWTGGREGRKVGREREEV